MGSEIFKTVAGTLRNAANTNSPATIPASAASGGYIKRLDRIAAAREMRVGLVKCVHIGIGSMIKRYRSELFLFLVVIALLLYGLSLFVPACEPTRGDSHQPSGICWRGGEVLLLLLIPFFWPMVFPLVYLLVNITFWLAPFFLRDRPDVNVVYTVTLAICAGLAWAAAGIVETICIGYFLWSLSFTVMLVGFVFSCLVPAPLEKRAIPTAVNGPSLSRHFLVGVVVGIIPGLFVIPFQKGCTILDLVQALSVMALFGAYMGFMAFNVKRMKSR